MEIFVCLSKVLSCEWTICNTYHSKASVWFIKEKKLLLLMIKAVFLQIFCAKFCKIKSGPCKKLDIWIGCIWTSQNRQTKIKKPSVTLVWYNGMQNVIFARRNSIFCSFWIMSPLQLKYYRKSYGRFILMGIVVSMGNHSVSNCQECVLHFLS